MKRIVMILLLLAAALSVMAADAPRLTSIDPLALPPPSLSTTPSYPLDPRAPAEKIAPSLLVRRSVLPPEGLVNVLVTLHEPTIARLVPTRADADRLNRDLVAFAEHDFVAQAAELGFLPIRGYGSFAIVHGDIPQSHLEAIAALPMVSGIKENQRRTPFRTEGGALMNSDDLRNGVSNAKGKNIGVAVVDSGIDNQHSELPWGTFSAGKKVVAWYDATGATGNPGNGYDDSHGHGTAVAGIIGGLNGGMAPESHLWAMKVFHDDHPNSGMDTTILDALDTTYAAKDDPEFGGVQVVNMSLGGSAPINYDCDADEPDYRNVFKKMNDAGIVVLVASGNDACSSGIAKPACVSYAIAVGAVYDANIGSGVQFGPSTCDAAGCTDPTTGADKITCYSNSGSPLDILGPSHCSRTCKPGGGYDDCFGGTSAATPYAAGVVAQLLSARSTRAMPTPAQIRTALTTTGPIITDARNGISRHRVDAMQAYSALGGGGGGGDFDYQQWIAATAKAPGAGGSLWTSDIAVLNRSNSNLNLKVVLHKSGGATKSGTASLGVGESGLFDDVLADLGESSASGAMEVLADQPFSLTSRTYNTSSAGTFGQYLPGLKSNEGIGSGESGILQQLSENANFRTNIGVLNMGTATATVSITLYSDTGATVGTFTMTIPPGESKQDNKSYSARFGRSNISGGYAVIQVTSGSGVWFYASVVDNGTGDGTTIPMIP